MADVSKVIEIVFAGNDKVSGTISTVSGKLDTFSTAVYAVAEPLSNIADDIIKFDTALVALTVGGLGLATVEAGKFETSFSEISTLLGITGTALDIFRGDILKYATDSSKSLGDITAAVYTALSAGTDYKDSLALLSAAEVLSIAGRADLDATTKLLAGTMNAYGADIDEAGRYSDTFFTIVKDGQTTLPDLNASLSRVSALAAAAGIPIETLGAAIAALTAANIPTAEAMSALKAALSNVIAPSNEAAKAASALGIDFDAAAIKTKGLDTVFRELYEATGGNITEMKKFFGSIEGLNAALIIGKDSSGTFAKAMGDMAIKAGVAAEAYGKMAAAIELQNQRVLTNIQVLLVQIGTDLLSSYSGLADGIIAVLKAIGVEVDRGTFDPLIDLITEFATEISTTLEGIAKAMPEAFEGIDWSGLLDALGDLGDSLGGIFDGIDLTDPQDLEKAIQFVVDSLESLARVTKGMVEEFKPFLLAIKNAIEGFNKLTKEEKESAGEIVALAKAITGFGIALTGLTLLLGDHADAIDLAFSETSSAVGGMVDSIGINLDIALLIIMFFVKHLIETLGLLPFSGWTKDAIIAIDTFTKKVKDDLVERSKKHLERLKKALFEVTPEIDSLTKALGTLPEQFVSDIRVTVESEGVTGLLEELDTIPLEKEVEVDVLLYPDLLEPIVGQVIEKIDEIPESKILEIMIQGEIDVELADIKAQAELIQNAVEWDAKLQIAEAAANAKILESAFDALAITVKTTSETLSGLYSLWEGADMFDRSKIDDWIKDEMEIKREAHEAEMRLVNAQLGYMYARTAALERGESLISITADGLEPELEAFMWQIIERVQIRATEEGAEFLLGI